MIIFVRTNLLEWALESSLDMVTRLRQFTDKLVDSQSIYDFETAFNWNASDISEYAAEGVIYHDLAASLRKGNPELTSDQILSNLIQHYNQKLLDANTSHAQSTNPMRAISHRGTIRGLATVVVALNQVKAGPATLYAKGDKRVRLEALHADL